MIKNILYRRLTKYTCSTIPFGNGEHIVSCYLYFDYYFLGLKFKSKMTNVKLSMFSNHKEWYENWDNLIKEKMKITVKLTEEEKTFLNI